MDITLPELKRKCRKALMRKWSTDYLMNEFFNEMDCLNARQLLEERGYIFEDRSGFDALDPRIIGYRNKKLDKKR